MCTHRTLLSGLSLTFTLLLLSTKVVAQTYPTYTCYIKYDHDAAGNRTSKYWYCCCGSPKSSLLEEASTDPIVPETAVLDDISIQVFPNPAKDDLTVAVSSAMDHATLEIHDVNGRVIRTARFQGERMNVPLDGIPTGLYNLRLIQGDEMLVKQFVVE